MISSRLIVGSSNAPPDIKHSKASVKPDRATAHNCGGVLAMTTNLIGARAAAAIRRLGSSGDAEALAGARELARVLKIGGLTLDGFARTVAAALSAAPEPAASAPAATAPKPSRQAYECTRHTPYEWRRRAEELLSQRLIAVSPATRDFVGPFAVGATITSQSDEHRLLSIWGQYQWHVQCGRKAQHIRRAGMRVVGSDSDTTSNSAADDDEYLPF